MADMAYVCLYSRYLQTLAPFTDAERGRIMTAMLLYSTTGEIPEFEGNERFIWPTIQAQIDRDTTAYRDKCAKNRENGTKGGRPPKNQTVIAETERFSEEPKKANTNTKTNTNKKSNDVVADKPPRRQGFSPPTVEEVRTYCTEKGYKIDPDRFVDHYTSNGWKVGKNPMKDWQAAVRTWTRKEQSNGQTQSHPLDGKTQSQPQWTVGTTV